MPLAPRQVRVKNHNGAHCAFGVQKNEFNRLRQELPSLVKQYAVQGQSVEVEEQDYVSSRTSSSDEPSQLCRYVYLEYICARSQCMFSLSLMFAMPVPRACS